MFPYICPPLIINLAYISLSTPAVQLILLFLIHIFPKSPLMPRVDGHLSSSSPSIYPLPTVHMSFSPPALLFSCYSFVLFFFFFPLPLVPRVHDFSFPALPTLLLLLTTVLPLLLFSYSLPLVLRFLLLLLVHFCSDATPQPEAQGPNVLSYSFFHPLLLSPLPPSLSDLSLPPSPSLSSSAASFGQEHVARK